MPVPFPAVCVSLYCNFILSCGVGFVPREMLIGGVFDVFSKEGPAEPLLGSVLWVAGLSDCQL